MHSREIRYAPFGGISPDLSSINVHDMHSRVLRTLQNASICGLADWRCVQDSENGTAPAVLLYNAKVAEQQARDCIAGEFTDPYPIIRVDVGTEDMPPGVMRTARMASVKRVVPGSYSMCTRCPLSLACLGGATAQFFRSSLDGSVIAFASTSEQYQRLGYFEILTPLKYSAMWESVPKDCPCAERVVSPIMGYAIKYAADRLIVSVSCTEII